MGGNSQVLLEVLFQHSPRETENDHKISGHISGLHMKLEPLSPQP